MKIIMGDLIKNKSGMMLNVRGDLKLYTVLNLEKYQYFLGQT